MKVEMTRRNNHYQMNCPWDLWVMDLRAQAAAERVIEGVRSVQDRKGARWVGVRLIPLEMVPLVA